MGKHSFNEIEKKLRQRKNPIVLAKVETNFSFDNKKLRFKLNIHTELTKPPKDLAELIYRLLCKREGSVSLIKNSRRCQCERGKQRSLLDLYTIVLTYAPETRYKEVHDIIEDLKHGKEKDGVIVGALLKSHYCTTTQRVVHNPASINVTEGQIRTEIGKKNIIFK